MKLPWNTERGGKKKRRTLHNQELHTKFVIPDNIRRVLLIVAGIVILVLLILLLRPQAQLMSSPEVAVLRRRGVIRIGVTENVPGLGDKEGGLEIDLAEAFAAYIMPEENAGAAILTQVTQNTALPRLNAGEADLLLCQLVYQSNERYSCSEAYYEDPMRLLCKAENVTLSIPGARIAVLQKSAALDAVKAYAAEQAFEVPPEILTYASYPDMLEALDQGEVQLVALPQSAAARYTAGRLLHPAKVGSLRYVAVGSGDAPAVVELFDRMLAQFEEDGTLLALLQNNGLAAAGAA